MKNIKFSLVIPCYNEAKNLELLVPRCVELCDKINAEVVFVDNGSSDHTPEVLAQLISDIPTLKSVKVPENRGYGFGILTGLEACTGDVIGWCHADMQTDPVDCVEGYLLFAEAENPDGLFVKGTRFGRPFADRVFSAGMSLFETILLLKPLHEINAQPTMLPKSFFKTWQDAPHDFSLDLFAYYSAQKSGLKVRRISVLFGERAHGISHWNINWAAKWKFIKRTVEYSLALKNRI